MPNKLSVLTFCLFCFCLQTWAQKETSNWYFSNSQGISFNTGSPQQINGIPSSLNFFDNTTVCSDAQGNLQFICVSGYPAAVYDKNYNPMPGTMPTGNAFLGRTLWAKFPGSSSKYYIFYPVASAVPDQVYIKYAVVDMSLNGGLGQVVTSDIVVDSIMSVAFCLINKPASDDFWIISNTCKTDSFYARLVDINGVSSQKKLSIAGLNPYKNEYNFTAMKASPNGEMFAGATTYNYPGPFAYSNNHIEVFNFNRQTGVITNKVQTTRMQGTLRHLEFSPNNKLLYCLAVQAAYGLQPCGFVNSFLTQYNLCYNDSLSFTNLAPVLGQKIFTCYFPIWGNLQTAPDKQLYMRFTGNTLSTIKYPNRIGTSATLIFNAFTTNNETGVYIPSFNQKETEKPVKNNILYSGGCYPGPLSFSVSNDTISQIQWNFGDPASGALNTSSMLNPSHVFSAPGYYTVTATLYNTSFAIIETLSELIEVKDPNKRLLYNYPTDTSICSGNAVTLNLSAVNGIFQWSLRNPGGTIVYTQGVGDSIVINSSGTYYVKLIQNGCNGCEMIDSIHVNVLPVPFVNLGPDNSICDGDSIRVGVYDYYNNINCVWSTGETTDSIWVKAAGQYWVTAVMNNNGCPKSDTINISVNPVVNISLPPDTTLCTGQTLLLSVFMPGATYLWQNNSTAPSFIVTAPGLYWVKVTKDGCSKTDSINVAYASAQQVNLGADSSLCAGNTITLDAGVPNVQYLWNTGATTQTIIATLTGLYWVRVNNGGCTLADTINLTFNTPPVVNLGKDTTICATKTLLLNSGVANAQYMWSSGTQSSSYIVTQPGQYWVEVKLGGCTVSDTINVAQYSVPTVNIGPDIRFCDGDSLTLTAPAGFVNYYWNTGNSTNTITLHQPGQYWLNCTTADGCVAGDTMQLLAPYPLPNINLGTDVSICKGTSKTLSAGNGFANYHWNTGATNSSITVSAPGIYGVSVTDQFGCKGSDSITIVSLLPLPSGFLFSDTAICSYGTIDIKAAGTYNSYLWNTGALTPVLTIAQPGTYWLQVSDINNCTGRDTINVLAKDCMLGMYFPNSFTPNKDGKNDEFKPLVFGVVEKYHFSIFNRYGQVIFNTDLPGKGWDGTFGGMPQDYGSFIWVCNYKLRNLPEHTEKGSVLLLR